MPSTQRPPRTDTRTQLLDAARHRVQRVGVAGMSFGQLADDVGIRRASVHHHFPAKEDLLGALIERYRAHVAERVERVVDAPGTSADRLVQYVALFRGLLTADGGPTLCLCAILEAEAARLPASLVERLQPFHGDHHRAIRGLLERGADDGSLRANDDPAAAARTLYATLQGAVLVVRSATDPARQFDALLAPVLAGLSETDRA